MTPHTEIINDLLKLAVDSGATETVIGEDMLTSIELKEGEAFRRGVQYEVANGILIPNLGEKSFVAVGEGGQNRTNESPGVRSEQSFTQRVKDGGSWR